MGMQMCRWSLALALIAKASLVLADAQSQPVAPAVAPAQPSTASGTPSPTMLARFQAAAKAAQAPDAGQRATAIVTLQELAADATASSALRHEALFRIAQARELDKTTPSLTLEAYRQVLAAQPSGEHAAVIELRIASLLAQLKDFRGARKVLEPLVEHLDRLPREMQAELLTLLSSTLAGDGDAAGSTASLVGLIEKGLAADEAQETQLLLKAGAALVTAGDTAGGLAIAEKMLKRDPPLAQANYKTVLLWLVQQQVNASNPQSAVSAIRAALDRHHDLSLNDALDLRVRLATILRTGAGDPAGSEKECQAILRTIKGLPAASCGSFRTAYDNATKELASIYSETDRGDALVSLVVETIDDVTASPAAISALIGLAQPVAATNNTTAGRLLDTIRRCIAREPANVMLGDACQFAVVALLLTQPDKGMEALQEARVLYRTVQSAKLLDATDLVVHAFKRADRNLARANAFLRFQRHGQAGTDGKLSTVDDLTDPLGALPAIPVDAVRNRAYSVALANAGNDGAGWLSRARLLAYMDRSPEAFNALVEAFAHCPPKETALQPIADELTTLVMRVTRDADLGQKVIDFIMYGAAGADGKANTSDDIGDAFDQVAKRLSALHTAPSQTAQLVAAPPPAAE